jgi:hypothetical protein
MPCFLQASDAPGARACVFVESGRNRLQPAITANIAPGHLLSTINGETGILAILHPILPERLSALITSFSHSDKSFILLKK